jgi:hypothetical protein
MATGNSFSALHYMYLVPTTTARFIPEVLAAISKPLKEYTDVCN